VCQFQFLLSPIPGELLDIFPGCSGSGVKITGELLLEGVVRQLLAQNRGDADGDVR